MVEECVAGVGMMEVLLHYKVFSGCMADGGRAVAAGMGGHGGAVAEIRVRVSCVRWRR